MAAGVGHFLESFQPLFMGSVQIMDVLATFFTFSLLFSNSGICYARVFLDVFLR